MKWNKETKLFQKYLLKYIVTKRDQTQKFKIIKERQENTQENEIQIREGLNMSEEKMMEKQDKE